MNNILNFKLFEYQSGKKIKTRWTVNDAIITLFYEKFGLHDLGIMEDQIEEFVNDYIGSTEASLIMQAANVRYVLSLKKGEVPTGLKDFSNAQVEAVQKYSNHSKSELKKIVEKILDNITEDEKINNAIKADEKKKEEREEKRQKEREEQRKLSEIIPPGRFGGDMKQIKVFKKDVTTPLNVGDIIKHKNFGNGEILDIAGDLLEIKFDSKKYNIMRIIYNPEKIELVEYDYKIEEPKKQILDEPDYKIEEPKKQILDKPTIYLDKPKKQKNIDKYRDFPRKPEQKIPVNPITGKDFIPLKGGERDVTIPFNVGDTIKHTTFGIGEVLDINKNMLTIKFRIGIKKVLYKPDSFI